MATTTPGETATDPSTPGEADIQLKIKGLPAGWKREVVIRKNGQSAGKTDVYYYSPCGKKFRSKPQIARFLGDLADLSVFDFSRAGTPGDGTQRRRARDRTAKKVDILKPLAIVRPLSNNPLRASGPVRRTCGVIKLPVTYVRMPSPSEEEGKERANSPDDSATDPENPKTNQINFECVTTVTPVSAIPALWENRLLGVKACDYETGDDIIPPPKITNGSSNETKHKTGNTNRVSTLKSPPPLSGPNVNTLLSQHLQQSLKAAVSLSNPSSPVIPSLLSHTGRVAPSVKNGQSKESHGVLVSLANKNTSSSKVIENLSRMVTETDLRLQEEKVRHLRQQLLAAEKC